jgi:NAD+ kinase
MALGSCRLRLVSSPRLRPSARWLARHLPALDVGAGGAHVAWAINDLVLARRGGTQLVVEVCVDGELYVRMAGDGIVVATPVGSSVYSMAAGGSLLAAGTNALVCTPLGTPLAMHGGCAPSLVVADDREVTIEIDPGRGGFDLAVERFPVETEAHRFSVSSERASATLVVLDGSLSGLAWLRERGLISDSPRVLARENQELRVSRGT